MNRTSYVATGALATLVAGSVFVAVGVAGASSATHSLTLHGKALSQKDLPKSNSIEADALSTHGKRVGYLTTSCNYGGTKDRCALSITLKGGILVGAITYPITTGAAATHAKGSITGGVGAFSGATGTVRVTATTRSETVHLTYSD